MQRGANGQRVGVSVRAAVRGRSQLSRRREWDVGAWDMLMLSGCCDMDVSCSRVLQSATCLLMTEVSGVWVGGFTIVVARRSNGRG